MSSQAPETAGSVVELSRLGDVAVVAGAIGLALALVNFALLAITGPAPGLLRDAESFDPGRRQLIGERVASAEHAMRTAATTDTSLLVVVGFSTAREDIDAGLLSASVCGHPRTLNLSGGGGSFRQLRYDLRALTRTSLHPAAVVIGMHPAWLAGVQVVEPTATLSEAARSPQPARLRLFKRWVAQRLWLRENQFRMRNLLTNVLLRGRDRVADAAALGPAGLYAPTTHDPWVSSFTYSGRRAEQGFLDLQMSHWRDSRWFDPKAYLDSGKEADALRSVIAGLDSMGAPVVAVLMPESTPMRQAIPSGALPTVSRILGGAGVSRVIDMRSSIPDTAFYDHAHLNANGRGLFTPMLGDSLSAVLGCTGRQAKKTQ